MVRVALIKFIIALTLVNYLQNNFFLSIKERNIQFPMNFFQNHVYNITFSSRGELGLCIYCRNLFITFLDNLNEYSPFLLYLNRIFKVRPTLTLESISKIQ